MRTETHHFLMNMYRVVAMCMVALAATCAFFYTTNTAAAQGVDIMNVVGVSFKVEPPYPAPGDEVTITASTYSLDMDVAMITWTVDGEPVQYLRGEKQYQYVAGDVGSETAIGVYFESPEGKTATDKITIRVGDVTIVWEADTYTPPFYGGRALHGPGSAITMLAIPSIVDDSGALYDPSTLSYIWAIDRNPNPIKSGHGLQSVTLTNPHPFSDLSVSVRIKNAQGDLIAAKATKIPVIKPLVYLYEAHPQMGPLYTRALSGVYYMESAKSVILAEPYFMTAESRTDAHLQYAWTIGSQKLTNPGSITLRPEGVGSGVARVGLSLTSTEMWQQRAGTDVSVHFDSAAAQANNPDTTPL